MRLLSLTRELRSPQSPIDHCLRTSLRQLDSVTADFAQQLNGAETLARHNPGSDHPYAMVGRAIDYRIKYYFDLPSLFLLPAVRGSMWWHSGRETSDVGTALDDRVPFPMWGPGNSQVSIPRVAAALFTSLQTLLTRVHPVHTRLAADDEAWLCRHCYGLALVERQMSSAVAGEPYELKRLKPGATLDDLWEMAPGDAVADVRRLSYLFHDRHHDLFSKTVTVAPQVVLSQQIGASPDLLVERTLVDLKATMRPRLDPLWLYQVVGYALLDETDHLQLERVGFYLVRQGVFVIWDIDHLLREVTGSPTMTRERLRATFRSAVWATHTKGIHPRTPRAGHRDA
jgi:hypothetical protein